MWPHLFIEGRRAVTGDGERPRYGLAFKKIFANGSKGIEQRAGLQADAAVHNPRPLIQRIAGADDARLLADGELELAGKHIGELFVRMVTYVLSGEFEFTIGEETRVVSAGDTLYKQPGIMHGCVCLQPGTLLDTFTPIREDFLVR